MAHTLSKLRQYVAAQGVGILPRGMYSTLRTAPVALYGTRALAGGAGVVTTLDETGNAEALLVDSTDYRGWLFGCAVVWNINNAISELSGVITNTQIQFNSMGVAKNLPAGICSSVFGGGGATTEPGSGQLINWHKFPNPLPFDGTDSATYIQLLNNNANATTANQDFTVYVDAWVARATDEPEPGNAILFPDDCPPSGVTWPRWLEMLARAAAVRASVRK
jgi:hypothetical protein